MLSLLSDQSRSIRESLKIALMKELMSTNEAQNDRNLMEKVLGIQLLGDAEPFASTLRQHWIICRETDIDIRKMGTPSQLFPGVEECQMWRGILAGESRFLKAVTFLGDNNTILALKLGNGQIILLFFSCIVQTGENPGASLTNPYLTYLENYNNDQSLKALDSEYTSFDFEYDPPQEEMDTWSSFQQEFESMVDERRLRFLHTLVHAQPKYSVDKKRKPNDKYWVIDNDSHTILFNQEVWDMVTEWLRPLPASNSEEAQDQIHGQKRHLAEEESSIQVKRQKR